MFPSLIRNGHNLPLHGLASHSEIPRNNTADQSATAARARLVVCEISYSRADLSLKWKFHPSIFQPSVKKTRIPRELLIFPRSTPGIPCNERHHHPVEGAFHGRRLGDRDSLRGFITQPVRSTLAENPESRAQSRTSNPSKNQRLIYEREKGMASSIISRSWTLTPTASLSFLISPWPRQDMTARASKV